MGVVSGRGPVSSKSKMTRGPQRAEEGLKYMHQKLKKQTIIKPNCFMKQNFYSNHLSGWHMSSILFAGWIWLYKKRSNEIKITYYSWIPRIKRKSFEYFMYNLIILKARNRFKEGAFIDYDNVIVLVLFWNWLLYHFTLYFDYRVKWYKSEPDQH